MAFAALALAVPEAEWNEKQAAKAAEAAEAGGYCEQRLERPSEHDLPSG
jgi:hypothetical protein